MSDQLTIEVQPTPNPNAVKFTLNRVVAAQATTYKDAASTQESWARGILEIPGVTQIFTVNTFVSVTKSSDSVWEDIIPQVERVMHETIGA